MLGPAQPQALVVLGASGDLARRKLYPALYDPYGIWWDAPVDPRFSLQRVVMGAIFGPLEPSPVGWFSGGSVPWQPFASASSRSAPVLRGHIGGTLADRHSHATVPPGSEQAFDRHIVLVVGRGIDPRTSRFSGARSTN